MKKSSKQDIRNYYKETGDKTIFGVYPWLKEEVESGIVSYGLGDTIAKITHATGLDKLANIYTNITGKPCGCQSRQEALNKLFPYGVKEDE